MLQSKRHAVNKTAHEINKKGRFDQEMEIENKPQSGTGSIMDVLRNSTSWRKGQALAQAKRAQQELNRTISA